MAQQPYSYMVKAICFDEHNNQKVLKEVLYLLNVYYYTGVCWLTYFDNRTTYWVLLAVRLT